MNDLSPPLEYLSFFVQLLRRETGCRPAHSFGGAPFRSCFGGRSKWLDPAASSRMSLPEIDERRDDKYSWFPRTGLSAEAIRHQFGRAAECDSRNESPGEERTMSDRGRRKPAVCIEPATGRRQGVLRG